MRKFLLAILTITSAIIIAQQPDSTWYYTYENDDWGEYVYDVVDGVDGGYLLAGTLYHDFYKDEEDYDAYFLKIDEDGSKKWSVYYGGVNHDFIHSVVKTTDSNYMAFGHTMEGNDWGNAWMVKIDKAGDTIWTKQFGGSSYDYGNYIDNTTDGGYILMGTTDGFDSYDPVFLIKTDEYGNEEWSNTYQAGLYSNASCVMETPNGGYIMAISTVFSWPAESLLYFIQTNANGDTLWTRYQDFERSEGIKKILLDDEYIYFIGTTHDNNYPYDVFMIKTTIDGDYLWDKSYGNELSQYCTDATFTPEGNILTIGSYGDASSRDVFAFEIDKEGDSLSTKTFGSSYFETPYAVYTKENHDLVVVGTVSNDTYEPDAFAMYLNYEITDVTRKHFGESISLNIYPNPCNNIASIQFGIDKMATSKLSIYDAYGRKIYAIMNIQASGSLNEIKFDCSDLSPGIYYCKLEMDNQVQVRKIIIAR